MRELEGVERVSSPEDFNWYISLLQTLLWIGQTTLFGGRVRINGWTRPDGLWISTTSMRTQSFILLQCTKRCEYNCLICDISTALWTSVSKHSTPAWVCAETWGWDILRNFHFANLWTLNTYDKITRYVGIFIRQVSWVSYSFFRSWILISILPLTNCGTTHHKHLIYHF